MKPIQRCTSVFHREAHSPPNLGFLSAEKNRNITEPLQKRVPPNSFNPFECTKKKKQGKWGLPARSRYGKGRSGVCGSGRRRYKEICCVHRSQTPTRCEQTVLKWKVYLKRKTPDWKIRKWN